MSAEHQPSSTLTREEILKALDALSEKLREKGVTGEVCLCGGTVMVLAFTARLTTRDVDAIFQPPQLIRELAKEIGEEHRLPAKKCMAARIGGTANEPSDVADIVFLIRHLNLRSPKEVLDLVAQYYPANRIPAKTQYLVEGLFEEGKI